jgi:hypothetical protein
MINSMESITVQVTIQHILEGRARSKCECPIALAIEQQLVHGACVMVMPYEVAIMFIDKVIVVDLPGNAIEFIEKFDKGILVNPFSFTLPNLSEWRIQ